MFIKDIKIEGGIHNREKWYADVTEKQLEELASELAIAIEKITRQSAWITVDYTKSIGHKINS